MTAPTPLPMIARRPRRHRRKFLPSTVARSSATFAARGANRIPASRLRANVRVAARLRSRPRSSALARPTCLVLPDIRSALLLRASLPRVLGAPIFHAGFPGTIFRATDSQRSGSQLHDSPEKRRSAASRLKPAPARVQTNVRWPQNSCHVAKRNADCRRHFEPFRRRRSSARAQTRRASA